MRIPGHWIAFSLVLIAPIAATARAAQDGSQNANSQAPAPPNVATPPADAVRTASGLAMLQLKSGAGAEHPAGDDCAVVTFTAWKRDGSVFSTSGAHAEPTSQCLNTAIPGISEALKLMVAGEKRRVWIPAELAFAAHVAHHGPKQLHEPPPPHVDLTVDVELIQILKAPRPPADLKLPPAGALRTISGVAIEILTPGTGSNHPNANSQVTLNYSGWTTDGKLFESTIMAGHPAVVLLGTALAGWREALPRMLPGEKARIWIPAALAYGNKPLERMVPAGDLVYDIELIEFK